MKKLLVAACTIALAVVAQASSFKWTVGSSGYVCVPGSGDEYTAISGDVVAYLFAADVKSDLVEAFAKGTLDLSKVTSVTSMTLTDGKNTTGQVFEYGADTDKNNYYMALVTTIGDKDYLYISPDKSGTGAKGKTTTVAVNALASSSAAAMDAADGYSVAGWYTTPEPTSAMLLLLGFAGLALRRRRA